MNTQKNMSPTRVLHHTNERRGQQFAAGGLAAHRLTVSFSPACRPLHPFSFSDLTAGLWAACKIPKWISPVGPICVFRRLCLFVLFMTDCWSLCPVFTGLEMCLSVQEECGRRMQFQFPLSSLLRATSWHSPLGI